MIPTGKARMLWNCGFRPTGAKFAKTTDGFVPKKGFTAVPPLVTIGDDGRRFIFKDTPGVYAFVIGNQEVGRIGSTNSLATRMSTHRNRNPSHKSQARDVSHRLREDISKVLGKGVEIWTVDKDTDQAILAPSIDESVRIGWEHHEYKDIEEKLIADLGTLWNHTGNPKHSNPDRMFTARLRRLGFEPYGTWEMERGVLFIDGLAGVPKNLGVYIFLVEHEKCIGYIGSSANVSNRLRDHSDSGKKIPHEDESGYREAVRDRGLHQEIVKARKQGRISVWAAFGSGEQLFEDAIRDAFRRLSFRTAEDALIKKIGPMWMYGKKDEAFDEVGTLYTRLRALATRTSSWSSHVCQLPCR